MHERHAIEGGGGGGVGARDHDGVGLDAESAVGVEDAHGGFVFVVLGEEALDVAVDLL